MLAITVFSIDGWLFKQSDWRLSSVLDKTISLTDSFMQMHNTVPSLDDLSQCTVYSLINF